MKTTLYDRDIQDVFVNTGKIHVAYYAPTEQAIYTKEDLEYMLWLLEGSNTVFQPIKNSKQLMDEERETVSSAMMEIISNARSDARGAYDLYDAGYRNLDVTRVGG